jgi:RsiW-degrading membrane proteinase PrsW (M82 family)
MNPYWLRRRRRAVKLWAPVLAILTVSGLVAWGVWTWMSSRATPAERASSVAAMGELDTAQMLAWNVLQTNASDLETWIRFIDLRAAVQDMNDAEALPVSAAVSDSDIRALLARVKDRTVATIALYWYETKTLSTKPDPAPIVALADAQPPAPLANYLLARVAGKDEDWATAARRLEREGLSFEKNRERNLRHALAVWMEHDAWKEVHARARDPRYRNIFDARFRLELATHDRDWPSILRYLWAAGYVDLQAWPVVLALLNAILWYLLATRLGRLGDGVPGRPAIYALAFILGLLSIYPTLIMITIEDMQGFVESGQPIPDAIYFIFGVGLREELCKLLLFLPLLPALKRRGSRIEAMTAGALVGLGFAAEENLGYFRDLSASVAVARFLTANFMHMALTSLVALSVYDASRGRSTPRDAFNVIFPLAIGIHGAYDFFLSSPQFSGYSLVSMMLLIIITQQFLRQLLIASSTMEQEGVLRLLVASLALLAGVSYIYATTLVGPGIALRLVALGFVGVAVMIWVFVRELSST